MERAHVHVRRERLEAQYWLVADVELFRNRGFEGYELSRIEQLLRQNRGRLLKLWKQGLSKKNAKSYSQDSCNGFGDRRSACHPTFSADDGRYQVAGRRTASPRSVLRRRGVGMACQLRE